MKKIRSGIIVFAVFVLFLLTVMTNVLAEGVGLEPENDFYIANKDKCVYLSRSFYANGDGGYLSIYKEPGVSSEVAVVKNGEIFNISFTYDYNGEQWGITEFIQPDTLEWTVGWILMDQLLAVYDYIMFEDDFGSEFYRYSGDNDALSEAEDIVLWTWPGSGNIAWVLQAVNRKPEEDEIYLVPSSAYKDVEGREWGFLFNVYSVRNSWVCLSDPSNLDIPAFNPAPEPTLKQPGEVHSGTTDTGTTDTEHPGYSDIVPDARQQYDDPSGPTSEVMSPLVLIVILAVVMVAVSILLILVFYKRKS